MKNSAEMCIQLAAHCAQVRNFPFSVDTSLWEQEGPGIGYSQVQLLRYAYQHKVLDSCIEGLGETLLPEAKQFVQRIQLEKAAKSLLLVHWEKLYELFNSLHVPVLIIKGPASSLQFYGNPFTRGYTDLDILVKIRRWADIVPGLRNIGWCTKEPESSVLQEPTSRLIMKGHHVVFVHKECPFRLEIHRSLDKDNSPKGRTVDQVFGDMQLIKWNSYTLPTLSLEDHIELIIDHGTHHMWMLLHWLCDAAVILQIKDESVHAEVIRRMIRKKQELSVELMIRIVRSIFPVEVPKAYDVLKKPIKNRTLHRLTSYCVHMLMDGGVTSTSLTSSLYRTYRYQLPLASGVRNKLSVAFSIWKISQQDVEKLTLPAFLLPLHILLRPFFVIQRRIQRKFAPRSDK